MVATVGGDSVAPVPSCHSESATVDVAPDAPVVALAGSPNVGKSTLFNALTGLNRDVGNWPGTTVAVGRGAWEVGGREVLLVDLPGAYSLDPQSPDEALTRALLLEPPVAERPDVVVVVASAAHLARGLYLLAQIRTTAQPVVLAVTMADVAARRGVRVDPAALAEALDVPVVDLDPRRRNRLDALAGVVEQVRQHEVPQPWSVEAEDPLDRADALFERINTAVSAAVTSTDTGRATWSDRIDRLVTSPILGPLIFLLVMWTVFQITTKVAAPIQAALGAVIDGPVAGVATWVLTLVGLDDTWVQGLVVDGLIAGVGMLLTFVPLMALMFLLLALLEDSGYMARAAVVTDRLMRAIGLPGRAFLPLVVGFGCNVPAISGTRVLPDARHRLLTALLVPFTSCTARLTVYVLVATTFFGSQAGTVVFGMYVLSIVLVVLVGLLLRSTLIRGIGGEPLVLDLPPYQLPLPRLLLASVWLRLRGFLRTAGGIVVITVVAVWALSATPMPDSGGSFGDVPVQDSVYAATAQTIAPVLVPAGFGTWETTSALMVGFVAKEAVISSWAQTFATAEPENARTPGALGDELQRTFDESSGGHTTAAVFAFLVFLLAYTPCVATLAAQRQEIGLRWTVIGVAMQLVVAWTLAVAIFQIGRAIS
ncbi:MAG: ferrous iron transport protein [Actinomycetota bacterium]|nr:ferrous iron transport protein [Actinomycetota bacterium]